MEVTIPSDWTYQTTPVASVPDAIIKNCSTYTLTSKDKAIKLTLEPTCQGWAGTASNWPSDAVIASQRRCTGVDGTHTCNRVRYTKSVNTYEYVDAITAPDGSIDKTKDQIQDALMIGYTQPADSKNDDFFIPAHLTLQYSGQESDLVNAMFIADEIASTLTLKN